MNKIDILAKDIEQYHCEDIISAINLYLLETNNSKGYMLIEYSEAQLNKITRGIDRLSVTKGQHFELMDDWLFYNEQTNEAFTVKDINDVINVDKFEMWLLSRK